jgi:hypothetical protein
MLYITTIITLNSSYACWICQRQSAQCAHSAEHYRTVSDQDQWMFLVCDFVTTRLTIKASARFSIKHTSFSHLDSRFAPLARSIVYICWLCLFRKFSYVSQLKYYFCRRTKVVGRTIVRDPCR